MSKPTQHAQPQQKPASSGNDETRHQALDAALHLSLSHVDDVIAAAAKIEAFLRDGTLPTPVEPKT